MATERSPDAFVRAAQASSHNHILAIFAVPVSGAAADCLLIKNMFHVTNLHM